MKNFIVFLFTVQYEEFNEVFHTSAFFSLTVKSFIKVSSLIILVNFIYLILERVSSSLSVVFICNYSKWKIKSYSTNYYFKGSLLSC